jgi:hypothetical protein
VPPQFKPYLDVAADLADGTSLINDATWSGEQGGFTVTVETPVVPQWEGDWDLPTYDDWVPAYGYEDGQGSFVITYPDLVDDRIVLVNPADPSDPWVWAPLPPGAPANGFLSWWLDGRTFRISYDGRMVLAWQVSKSMWDAWVAAGASAGYFNTSTRTFQLAEPEGVQIPLWFTSDAPLGGPYLVDTTTWESESGDNLTEHGIRWKGYDVLLFPDRAEVGELFQDKYILTADRVYRAGRKDPPFIVDAVEAQKIYDAGYGWALYPVPGEG